MAGAANLIKAQILANLNTLVSSGVLGFVVEKDINPNVLDTDFPSYPCAVLGTSSMEAGWEYQYSNKRTYNFDVLIVDLLENLTTMGDMEDLRDAVALQIDQNFTLAGTAVAGVQAVYSPRVTVAGQGKTLVVFYVTLKATTLVSLS